MIDRRIAERRRLVRDESRRRRLRRTIVVTTLVVLVAILAAVERSALVGLEEVRVAGVERLTPDEVVDAAAVELGTSTLRLRLARVEDRVEALPAVRTATARRLDPLTVEIEVVEREPELVADGRGGSVLVDRDGIVLAAGEQDGLPVVAVHGEVPRPGEDVHVAPALANAHRAWRQLSGPLRAEVVALEARSPDELTLTLRSGVEVRFGRAERVDEKVRALGAVLEDVDDAEVAVVDVRAPSAPVVVGP